MTENATPTVPRDDRPARSPEFGLGLLCFLVALAVRCLGLTWGLPDATRWYSYHPDESPHQIVGALVSLLQGSADPHFFNYPSLSIYLSYLIYLAMGALRLTSDANAVTYPWPVIHDLILAGRVLSALTGAGCAWLGFTIGGRLGGRNSGFLAGVLMALLPGLVQHSHFATVDVPTCFFVLLCLELTGRATTPKLLLWAAAAAGAAAATKYNGALVLAAPITALWFLPAAVAPPKKGRAVLSLLLVAIAVFFVGCPYALISPHEFWNGGFAYELFVHPHEGSGEIFQGTGNGWWYHLTYNLPFVMTWPVLLGGFAGLYLLSRNHEKRPLLIPQAVFFGLYLFTLGFSQVRYMRYTLPLAVLLAIWAGTLPGLRGQFRAGKPWKFTAAAVLAVFAALGTLNVLWPLTHEDPRDQAMSSLCTRSWNEPQFATGGANGAPIEVGLLNQPWFYTPPFVPLDHIDSRGQQFETTTSVNFIPRVVSIDDWLNATSAPPDRLVYSDFEIRDLQRLHPGQAAQLEALFAKNYGHQAVFVNTSPLLLPGRDFVPHDYLYPNPTITLLEK